MPEKTEKYNLLGICGEFGNKGANRITDHTVEMICCMLALHPKVSFDNKGTV